MKKRIITSTAFAACLALCAAMWPQNDPAVETSVLPTPPAVIAAQPEVSEMPEIEEIIMPEEEKTDVTQPEPIEEADAALEPIPVQTLRRVKARLPPNRMPHHRKNGASP